MDLTTGTRNAYWAVAAAAERLRVAQKSLEQRRALLDQTKAQYEVGVVSRVDVTQAEAGVAQGEVDLIVAENAYRTQQDNLIQIVLGPHLTPDSGLEIRPTDSPEDVVTFAANLVSMDPTRPVVLKADSNVPYRNVDKIIDSLKQAKVELIYLLSEQKTVEDLAGG